MTNRDDKFRSIRYGSVEWYRLIEDLVTALVANEADETDVKTSPQYGITTSSSGNLVGVVKTPKQLKSASPTTLICKGTLENILESLVVELPDGTEAKLKIK